MKFTGIKRDGVLVYDDPMERSKYIDRMKDGRLFTEDLKGLREPKTSSQLGYYYGVLLPAVFLEREESGDTDVAQICGKLVQFKPTKESTHQMLKSLCGTFDDKTYDVGDMNIEAMSSFITEVLATCAQMGMDVEALEAKRTECNRATDGPL